MNKLLNNTENIAKASICYNAHQEKLYVLELAGIDGKYIVITNHDLAYRTEIYGSRYRGKILESYGSWFSPVIACRIKYLVNKSRLVLKSSSESTIKSE